MVKSLTQTGSTASEAVFVGQKNSYMDSLNLRFIWDDQKISPKTVVTRALSSRGRMSAVDKNGEEDSDLYSVNKFN